MSDLVHGDFYKEITSRDVSDIVACCRQIHSTLFRVQVSQLRHSKF
jgi:hypothetical protein